MKTKFRRFSLVLRVYDEVVAERRWLQSSLLACLVVAVYAPLLMRCGFIWDDNLLIFNNPLVIASRHGLLAAWQGMREPDYYPLTWTLFWLEWHVFYPLGLGDAPLPYHAVNVLLHAMGVVILWRALDAWRVPGAWWGALFFGAHPLAVGTAAWVAEGKNTLSFILYGLSLLWWARSLDEVAPTRCWLFSWLAFVLALLAKTSGVLLPLVLAMLEWWRYGRVQRTSWLRLAFFVAVAAALGLVAMWFQSTRVIGSSAVRPPGEGAAFKLLAAGWELGFYLWKSLVPTGLAMLYPRWQPSPASPLAWLPLLAVVALGLALWCMVERWGRGPFAAFVCWLLLLAPVLGFIDLNLMRYTLVADHWAYLSLVPPMALLAAVVCRCVPDPARVPICVAVALALTALSVRHELVYRSSEELWSYNTQRYPTSWMSWRMLANRELDLGHVDAAGHAIAEAARLNPQVAQLFYDWGRVLERQGQPAAALEKYSQALRLYPAYSEAMDNIGMLHLHAGDVNAAAHEFERAAQMDPHNLQALNNLAWLAATTHDARFRNGRAALDMAGRVCTETQGDNPDYLDTLAAAYAASGDFDKAQFYCKLAIKLAGQLEFPQVAVEARRHLESYERHQALQE